MKRFVSLALAAAMTLSIAPVSALAATNNSVTKIVSVSKDDVLKDNAPVIVIENSLNHIHAGDKLDFSLKLEGAEWDDSGLIEIGLNGSGFVTAGTDFTTTEVSDRLYISIPSTSSLIPSGGQELHIKLKGVKVTGDTAKVTIEGENSAISTTTHTFAKSANGGALITIDGKKDFADGGKINDIIIEEVTATSLANGGKLKLKLNGGFKFIGDSKLVIAKGGGTSTAEILGHRDGRDLVFDVRPGFLDTDEPNPEISIMKVTGLQIAEDGAKYGDTAEITVSGEGLGDLTKTTVEVGKYIDYGVTVSTQDKDLPTIYSGRTFKDDENRTLKLTVKEGVADSWFTEQRKTTFTFPEGVKVKKVNIDDDTENFEREGSLDTKFSIDGNVVTFTNAEKSKDSNQKLKKATLVATFDLWVSPTFTGDITCEVGGPAINENQKVTIAKAVSPVAIEANKTPVSIDYRNVSVGDITLKEAEAGLWDRGETITLNVENMQFESGMKAEVVEGDGEIKKIDVNKGNVKITVDSESSKTPMKIKLSGVSLYLDRTLPVGDYPLNIVLDGGDKAKSVIFQTYNREDGNLPTNTDGAENANFGFDVDEIEVMKDYVTVTTAGRDQGSTFTTEVGVTIDSTTMKVDGKDVTLEVPAFLSAEGWTMLPIRAVTEALATSSNTQPVDWIPGNPGTIIIRYGDKTVSMTLGSTTMYINGTPVPMSTAPTIVNERAFLPMRDLGRALGLTENEIVWDSTTRTATLNPKTKAASTTTNN